MVNSYIKGKYFSLTAILCLLGIISAFAITILSHTWLVKHYELKTLDYLYRFRINKEKLSDHILLIEVDDTTIQRLGWPLRRDYYAILLELLRSGGAKVIAFDIVFSDTSYYPGDGEALIDETAKSDNIIHAAIFGYSETSSVSDSQTHLDNQLAIDQNPGYDLPEANRVLLPITDLLKSTAQIADISVEPDNDGIVRRLPLIRKYKGKIYPSLALIAIITFFDIEMDDIKISPGKQIEMIKNNNEKISIPIDGQGRMLINYVDPGSYSGAERSLLWIFNQYMDIKDEELVDVTDQSLLQDKLVIIGKVVTGDTIDQKPTPFSSSFPGLRIHASAISNIIQQKFIKQMPAYITSAISVLLSLIIALAVRFLKPIYRLITFLLILVIYTLSSYVIFVYYGLWITPLETFLAIFASFISTTFYLYIFEKKRIIASLERLSRYNESIMENMGDALLVVNSDSTVSKFNKRAEEILGIKEGIIGKNYRNALSGVSQRLMELVSKSLEKRDTVTNEEILANRGNVEQFLEVTSSLFRDENDKGIGTIVIVRDVSELRQIQKQMHLRERLSAIGELAGEISHEIKNSLQGIKLFAEHLISALAPDDSNQEYVNEIITAATDLGKEVNRLNEYAKPVELNYINGSINNVLESSISFAEDEIEKNGIKIVRFYQQDLPEIPFDEAHLKQALLNLIINATHAMPNGGMLTLETNLNDKFVDILVSDTGTGIPENIRGLIFNPYFTTKKGTGTGLGLSVAYKNIEAHGGNIQLLTTEIGKGSTFIIRLPLGGERNEQSSGGR